MPAIRSSRTLFSLSAEPIAVAPRPSRMKIAEKLVMKSRLGTITRRTLALGSSLGAIPATVER